MFSLYYALSGYLNRQRARLARNIGWSNAELVLSSLLFFVVTVAMLVVHFVAPTNTESGGEVTLAIASLWKTGAWVVGAIDALLVARWVSLYVAHRRRMALTTGASRTGKSYQ